MKAPNLQPDLIIGDINDFVLFDTWYSIRRTGTEIVSKLH